MDCQNKINHTVQYGDSLYKISKKYNTTIQNILNHNLRLNPYNLQVGSTIIVCMNTYDDKIDTSGQNIASSVLSENTIPNEVINQGFDDTNILYDNYTDNDFTLPESPSSYNNFEESVQIYNNVTNQELSSNAATNTSSTNNIEFELFTKMNHLLEELSYWIRMFLISVSEDLPDLNSTNIRLSQTSKNITNFYRNYCEEKSALMIEKLLTEHIEITKEVIMAFKNGYQLDCSNMTELQNNWHKNADEIANLFNSFNHNYQKNNLKDMLYNHLDLLTKKIIARIRNEYDQEILIFDTLLEETLKLSYYLANGIILQFPQRF